MIALFARSNHPIGYGYGPFARGVGSAHGYVVIGVRCSTRKQVAAIIEHIRQEGLDLPDTGQGRKIYTNENEKPVYRGVTSKEVVRWYSGGPSDWDYLFTVSGDRKVVVKNEGWYGESRGDNRFTTVYDAADVLSS